MLEKSPYFGGSTALSGGGIWVPGAPAQRRAGYAPRPEGVVEYLRQITDGLVSDARIRQYVESAPKMLEFLEGLCRLVRVRLEARLCRLLPGIARRLRTRQHHQCATHRSAQAGRRRAEPARSRWRSRPRESGWAPRSFDTFYRIRQSWAGKGVLLKLVARMVRARVFGERMAAIGQSLAARLRLAMRERGIPLWLDSPMIELITDADGSVTGAVVERDGAKQRIAARARRDPGFRGLRPRPRLAQGAPTRRGPGLELRQPRGDGRRHPRRPKGRRRDRPARRGVVVPGDPMAGWPNAIHAQRADDAVRSSSSTAKASASSTRRRPTWTSATP